MPKPVPEAIKAQAQALYVSGVAAKDIGIKLRSEGVTAHLVRRWALKHCWALGKTRLEQELTKGAASVVADKLQELSQRARITLGDEIVSQVELLKDNPAKKLEDLVTTPARQGRAAMVKTIVDTASALFADWEQKGPSCAIFVGAGGTVAQVQTGLPEREAIDVESESSSE